MQRHLANLVTVSRLIILPIFVYIMIKETPHYRLIGGGLFVISALSDYCDGYIARKLDIVSKLGRILDPLADKLSLITVYILLTFKGVIPLPAGSIILTREGTIFLATGVFFLTGMDLVFPSRLGKITAAVLYIAACINVFDLQPLGLISVWLAAILAVFSALDYARITFIKLTRATPVE